MATGLRAAFESRRYKFPSDELEDRCANLAITHDLSGEELALEYERMMMSRQAAGNQVSESDLDALSHELERTRAKRAAKRQALPARGAQHGVDVLLDSTNRAADISLQTPGKPGRGAAGPTPHKTPTSVSFHNRKQAGEVVKTLNAHLQQDAAEAMDVEACEPCRVELLAPGPVPGCKLIGNSVAARVALLEARMADFAAALEAAEGTPASTPVNVPIQEAGLCVGRVVCEGEGRLNASSALLEGTLAASRGASIKLDLSALPAFRIFPGQVVGVHGLNPSGGCLIARRLVAHLPRPMPTSSLDELHRYASATGPRGVVLCVAAGPFTTSEDVGFAPLRELLAACATRRPDALLLLGPFVDAEHPLVASGALDVTFEELFQAQGGILCLRRAEQVLAPLAAFAEASGVQVLLLPSPRDAHADPVFPQPPLARPPGLPGGVRMLPNPATFRLNEIVIGAATPDFLKQVSSQEVSQGVTPDRMACLAAHIIGQRNYFPLYPPPLGAMLDASLGAHLDLPVTPDILILPSDLAPFAKLVPLEGLCSAGNSGSMAGPNGAAGAVGAPGARGGGGGNAVVCVNPGRLVKDRSGATYARLQVAASREGLDAAAGQPPATNGKLPHAVDARCFAEIRRI